MADGGQGTWLIDWVLGATIVETLALLLMRALTGRGVPARELIAFLGAGLALLVAVRLAVGGASLAWLGATLLAALVLHLWMLVQRWQR